MVLQLIVVAGAAESIWISCELTVSALPAVSVEKNFTVEVLATVNGAVYTVLAAVGVLPSVV